MISISASFAPFCQPLLFAGPDPVQVKQRTAAPSSAPRRPRVVVAGSGPAALSVVEGLRGAKADVIMLDARHGGLVQPLLLDQPDPTVLLGRVTEIDMARHCVVLDQPGATEIPYDKLVIATGAGREKAGDAAGAIRQRMLLAFDYAESEPDPAERRRLLTFAVIGGGPIGVEMASSLCGMVEQILADEVRAVSKEEVRIVLAEAGPRLLPDFSETLSRQRHNALEGCGVQIRLGSPVTEAAADHVMIGAERIETRTAIWTAGTGPSGIGSWLRAHADRHGSVQVTDRLTLPGQEGSIYVIGPGSRVAGARSAMRQRAADWQEGAYVARAIRLELEGRRAGPFRYSWVSRLRASMADMAAACLRLRRPARLGWTVPKPASF